MIKDVTAAEIRKWVGSTTFDSHGLASADEDTASLHRFLYWVHYNDEIPLLATGRFSDRFAFKRINAAPDEDVVKWYLLWLMNGGKRE